MRVLAILGIDLKGGEFLRALIGQEIKARADG
jgi:hypothetical protein